MSDLETAAQLTVKRLASGYWLVKGRGQCNWGQYDRWPAPPEEQARGTFAGASLEFRQAVAREWEREETR